MKKSGRKILSVILTAVMVFALLPVFGKPMVVKAETTPTSNHVHGAYADKTCSEHAGWREISSQAELKTLCEGGGNGYLKDSINVTETINVSSGKEVSICLNGYSITQNADKDVFYVEGTLNLFNEGENSGKITHASGYTGSGVKVNTGTFNMYGGKISENTALRGCGVCVESAGTFTMTGGEISENATVLATSFLEGIGGGVYVDRDGTFTMTGGKISDNYADNGGGGVNLLGTFLMTGGEISGNDGLDGGGVRVAVGTFTMTGGKISGNEAHVGGGVSVEPAGTFTMTGGEISGNTHDLTSTEKENGCAVKGTILITGGEISDGTFIFYDGEVLITDEGTIESITYDDIVKIIYHSNEAYAKTVTQYAGSGNRNYASNQFTNDGKKFIEWNTLPDGSGESYTDKDKIKLDDLELYAQWINPNVNSYNVTFKVENGSWDNGEKGDITVPLSRKQNEDKLLRLSESCIPSVGTNSEPGFKAGSWNETPNTGKVINDNITFTYTYAPDPDAVKYTITYDANGGTVSKTSEETGFDHRLAYLLTPEEREGYDFVGWYTDKTDGNKVDKDTVFDSGTTVYAHWKAHSYTIVFDANGGSGNIDDMLNREYDDNIALTANTFTFDGHTFSGWNTQTDGNGTSYADESTDTLTIEDGVTVTLYAQWDDVFYDINTSDDGNGTANASATTGIKGTNITLKATPNEGFKFAGWEIISGEATIKDVSAVSTTLAIGNSDVEVMATFEEITEESKPQPDSTELTEPETEDLTDPEPEPEIPERDWLDDLRLQLQIVNELGGPRTVTYSGDFALSYDIMQYLVEHPDITLIYTVTYEGVDYTITIPGGKAIADPNIPWYGPLWLLANYGGDKVPEVLAGSGKYTVVAGDTLSGIAAKFNTTVEELARKNGIENPNYIIVGQVIVY